MSTRPVELLYQGGVHGTALSGWYYSSSFATVAAAERAALRRLREQAAAYPDLARWAVYRVVDYRDPGDVRYYGWPTTVPGEQLGDAGREAVRSGALPPRRLRPARLGTSLWEDWTEEEPAGG